jgi:7-keto-8-aminopelargonate synthetase-like enzyme
MARLGNGLRRTGQSISTVFTGTKIDDDLYEELETALLMADAGVQAAYLEMQRGSALEPLRQNIRFFTEQIPASLRPQFIQSRSAIQSLVYPGNSAVRELAKTLQDQGFAMWPILHPTVPKGQERLRICLHSFNTEEQIQRLLDLLEKEILPQTGVISIF